MDVSVGVLFKFRLLVRRVTLKTYEMDEGNKLIEKLCSDTRRYVLPSSGFKPLLTVTEFCYNVSMFVCKKTLMLTS